MQHMVLKLHPELCITSVLQELRMCICVNSKELTTAHKSASECGQHQLCWVLCIPLATVCCWQADLRTVLQLAIQELLASAGRRCVSWKNATTVPR